jgi:hypothetical protein
MNDNPSSRAILRKLLWILPITAASLIFIASFNPAFDRIFLENRFASGLMIFLSVVAPVGAFWGIYRCIRYEQRPGKYLAIVIFVPMGFIWYYVERYSKNKRPWAVQEENQS